MRIKKLNRVAAGLAVLAAAGMTVAGCGSSTKKVAASSTTTASSSPSGSSASSASGGSGSGSGSSSGGSGAAICNSPAMTDLKSDVTSLVTNLTADGTDKTKLASDINAGVAKLRADGAKAGNADLAKAFTGTADFFATLSSAAETGQAPNLTTITDNLAKIAQQTGTTNC